MNTPPFIERKQELLTSALTLVFSYYSLRLSLFLPSCREMFVSTDESLPLITKLVLGNAGLVTILVVVASVITLWAIWSSHRLAGLAAALGIVSLGIGVQLLWWAVTTPIFHMINAMGTQ